MPPTISLAMIVRDREKELSRCLQLVCQHVDEIVVVDAGGSIDGTVQVAKDFGARVILFTPETHPESFYLDAPETFAGTEYDIPGPFTGRHGLADFATPRNLSFAECTKDWIFWLDSDDIIENPDKIRWMASAVEEKGVDGAFLRYEYDFDEQGRCIMKQIRERLIRRSDFVSGKVKWNQVIHEHLQGMKKGLLFEELLVKHQSPVIENTLTESAGLKIQTAHRDRVRFRNLKNLVIEKKRLDQKGEELPFRLHFYLGSELRSIAPEKAIEHFTKYIPLTHWDEERAQARAYIAHIREMQMRHEEAWNYYAGATVDFPGNPAPWFGLARIAFLRGDWKKVAAFSEEGLRQVKEDILQKPSLVQNPFEWQYRAHLTYSRALIELGRFDEAKASCEKGLSHEPTCPFLKEHLQMIADGTRANGKEAA